MSGIYNAIQSYETPENFRKIAQGISQKGDQAVQDAQAAKPQMPSMMPEPKMAALMALLSGLSNNQFRRDDDPFQNYLNAYQSTAQSQYQQALDKWQKQQDQATLTQQNANKQADLWNKNADALDQNRKDDQTAIENYNQRVQAFNNIYNTYSQHPNGIDPNSFQKLEDEAIRLDTLRHSMHLHNASLFKQLQSPVDIYGGKGAKGYYDARDAAAVQRATSDAIREIPARYQSFAPLMDAGTKRTQALLDLYDAADQNPSSDNTSIPPWQKANSSGMTPVQVELGNTFRRHEAYGALVDRMKQKQYDVADANSPEHKAYQNALDQYNANAAQLPRLAARKEAHPSPTQSSFLLQAAQAAVQNKADEELVIGRLRKLLAGQPAKDPKNPFGDLIPATN